LHVILVYHEEKPLRIWINKINPRICKPKREVVRTVNGQVILDLLANIIRQALRALDIFFKSTYIFIRKHMKYYGNHMISWMTKNYKDSDVGSQKRKA